MKVKVYYYNADKNGHGELHHYREFKAPLYYSDNRIRDMLIFELEQNGYLDCIMDRAGYIDNTFDVYDASTFEKLLEVFWITDYSLLDRLKFKLFPMHYAKKVVNNDNEY